MPKGIYKGNENKKLTALNNAYSFELEEYKSRAAAYRANRKYNINEISKAAFNIIDYVKECNNSGSPATIAGIILASGTNKDFYYKAKSGQYDYITTEYIEQNNIDISECVTDPDGLLIYTDKNTNSVVVLSMISEIIEKCLLLIENDLQIRSLTDKSMSRTTGAIFNLKAVFNYNDKPETETKTVNNTLIVNANPEQTAKAMQLLLDNK